MRILKALTKASVIQPVLTFVLIILLVVMVTQFFGGKFSNNNASVKRELTRKVTFDSAAAKYTSTSYEAYTRGSLLVKNTQRASIDIGNKSINPQATTQPSAIGATENKYDDLFFVLDNGLVKKLDFKTFGQNESLFFDKKDQIIFVSNTNSAYSLYPVPAETEKDALLLFSSTRQMLQEVFPLVSLIRDYKDGKFNPVERATNLYSGKWKHALFTSDEITDVFLETDPYTGLFSSFTVAHGFANVTSRIVFDFKPLKIDESIFSVPNGFTQVPLEIKYKAKES